MIELRMKQYMEKVKLQYLLPIVFPDIVFHSPIVTSDMEMYFKKILMLSVALLFVTIISRAEVIDNRDSRQEYARSVSQLGTLGNSVDPSSPRLRKGAQPSRTLVLFRTLEGTPEFGAYEPDILILGPQGCFTAAYKDEETALAAIEYLQTMPDIIYAELDGEVCASDEMTDLISDEQQDVESQHSFHSHGALEMGFGKATPWCKRAGIGSVTIAVIDSGVYPHPFLAARLENGGFDYVDGDEDATSDSYGHGTHVAGIIVDCTPGLEVYIRPIRVLNASGKGSIANTTSAIFEAAEAGCGIINLSLTTSRHSEALEDAVRFALNCESTVVASAGNNGEDTSGYCPVHMDDAGLIVVGACNGSLDTPMQASYSNYGSNVDVYAFGTSIQACSLTGGYVSKTGTSQAAPHVSALCAILKRLFPSIGCGQIELRVKALAGKGDINIPNVSLLVPQTMGVGAQDVYLPIGTEIKLMETALPETSFIKMSWHCENDSIAMVNESGVLTCMKEGITVLYGDGSVNESVSVNLHVISDGSVFHIPSSVTTVEAEAFVGTATSAIYLPTGLQSLEKSAFSNSNLKTIFYSGDSMLFEELQDVDRHLCIVTDGQENLWQELKNAGINYLLSCR